MSSVELQPFFNAKVAFPHLEKIVISHLDDLTMIWNNELAHCSFAKLKLIKVEGCNELLFLFPSNTFGRFSSLEFLIVNDCGSLEELLGFHGSNFETSQAIPENKLKVVSASNCRSLKNIFQASIAKRLLQLEQLRISHCRGLTSIVAKEGVESNIVKFVFPKLNSIDLANLPELAAFYPGVHTSEWHVLKELKVAGCENVETFTSEMLNFRKSNDETQLDIARQPFFVVEKVIPKLEVLDLGMKDIMTIFHGQFARDLFIKLNTLSIHQNKADAFPRFLERFYNLNSLTLCCSSYKELFSHEDMEEHAGNFTRVKSLGLRNLPNLKHMWKQDSKLNSILQNLQTLLVEYCDSLINLVPPSASFQNLTTLRVCYCERMKNLVTSSTAKSLERLRKMSIEGCERMAEIIANEGDVAEDEIIFSKLEKLSLVDLQRLTSFCSANYALKFPSLGILIVRDCPMMKIFCEGALSTSKLEMVCQSKEEWRRDIGCWEGELNTTVQQLYSKMNFQRRSGSAFCALAGIIKAILV